MGYRGEFVRSLSGRGSVTFAWIWAIVSGTYGHLGGQGENEESTGSAEWPRITGRCASPP